MQDNLIIVILSSVQGTHNPEPKHNSSSTMELENLDIEDQESTPIIIRWVGRHQDKVTLLPLSKPRALSVERYRQLYVYCWLAQVVV